MPSKIPIFEDFIPLGFGMNMTQPYTAMNTSTPSTGYNIDAIVGPIMDLGESVAEHAYQYESNDNPNHKGLDYIKEAKKKICEYIDEAYESKCQSNK